MLRVAAYAQRTDTGLQRRANEDAHFARAPLFAVADGMGGAQAGEVASGIAIEVLSAGVGGGPGSAEEQLAALVHEANARIHDMSVRDRGHAGMGTTTTAAYVGEHEVSLAHVGDSRAYLLRDGVLERLTHDHSLVEEFVRQGKLTPEEADEHPQRSIITRALGPEPDVEVDRLSVRGRAGDVFLLCSDGLTSMVPEATVGDLLRAAASLEDAARSLIDAANDAGGRDNITVVLFTLEELDDGDPGATGQHTLVGSDAPTAPRRLAPRSPSGRRPASEAPRKRKRRWLGPLIVVAIIAIPVISGAFLAVQAVYFIGATPDGSVAVFNGLPYKLPGGIHLYTTEYVTGLTVDQIPSGRRKQLLDHKLRSHDDAQDLARQLELGQLSAT